MKGGVEHYVKSEYKTAFQSGQLDPHPGANYGFGFGFYGLLDHVNISWEFSRTNISRTSFDVEMDTRKRSLFVDYYFDDQPQDGFFVGVGFGSHEVSLFGDDLDDSAGAVTLRGGYYKKLASPATIGFLRGSITSVEKTHLKRFYFFGSSADIEQLSVALEVGVTFNIFYKQKIAESPQESVEKPIENLTAPQGESSL